MPFPILPLTHAFASVKNKSLSCLCTALPSLALVSAFRIRVQPLRMCSRFISPTTPCMFDVFAPLSEFSSTTAGPCTATLPNPHPSGDNDNVILFNQSFLSTPPPPQVFNVRTTHASRCLIFRAHSSGATGVGLPGHLFQPRSRRQRVLARCLSHVWRRGTSAGPRVHRSHRRGPVVRGHAGPR